MRDRWTTWARSMAERHERFTARQGLLVMTLLEPLKMSVAINQRLESFAFAVFPRIQVSIGPILNELGYRQFSSSSLFSMTRSLSSSFSTMRFWSAFSALATAKSYQLRQFANHQDETTQISVHDARRSVVLNDPRIETSNHNTQSPVLRVFARFDERDPGVVLRKLLFENESQKVLQRVTREHLRVEQRTRGDMVIRTQSKPAAVVEDRRRELETQFSSAAKTPGRSPWPEKPPEINVEQLTEQVIRRIDHRITAYRERLGRAF